MTRIHIDLETRSEADLRKTGVHVYAEHPSTDVWCACWAVDDGPVQVWRRGEPAPAGVMELAASATFVAHNAGFERTLWAKVLARKWDVACPPLEQWDCTAARASAMALPRSLDDAARALGLSARKDVQGGALMLRMARPRSYGPDGQAVWWDDETRLARLVDYCRQDVEVERALDRRLRTLDPTERSLWMLDQRINERGLQVDRVFVDQAVKLVEKAGRALDARIHQATGGRVERASARQQIVNWLAGEGLQVESIDQASVETLLGDEATPARVRAVLEIRAEAAKTSTAKLKTLQQRTGRDGRMRDSLLYHGAGTGRWSGVGFQPQNLPRPALRQREVDWAIERIRGGCEVEELALMLGHPLAVISDCIRGCLVAAPEKSLIAADFVAIEGRVLAWLAGEEWVLDAYRRGADLYCLDAESIYGRVIDPKVDKQERLIGKTANLALGFSGGKGAFAKMAAKFGLNVEPERAEEIKQAWRDSRPATVQLWRDLGRESMLAVQAPGVVRTVGRLRFRVKGGFLWMILPTGRPLAYAAPQVEPVKMPWGEMRQAVTYLGVNSVTRKWERQVLSPMVLSENPTQAVARDLMAAAMLRLEAAGYPVVLTVHDEVVCERETSECDLALFERIMTETPAWAEGCPIAVEGWIGQRYRK